MTFDFPDDSINVIQDNYELDTWILWFDGASNLSGHGIGAVLISLTGHYYPMVAKLTFPCTSNIAEYEAYIMGLHEALSKGITKLQVFGISTLVICQVRKEWETWNLTHSLPRDDM